MSNIIPEYWVPINRNLAGDFIGFTFDNIHSSDFNLIRVSNGSRYESNLLPSFQDATIQGEGKDGLFYFGSTFKEKLLKISTAFDELTEENYRKLAETFSDKKLHKLWFDETPYKAHYVKLKQSPIFKNICFDEGENRERIYRGEMDLEFTCYPSFGEARAAHLNQLLPKEEFVLVFTKEEDNKTLLFHNHLLGMELTQKRFYKFYGANGATLADSYNLKEWQNSSKLEKTNTIKQITTDEGVIKEITEWQSENEETKETTESFEWSEGISLPVYNPGTKEADIKIIFTPNDGTKKFPSTQLVLYTISREFENKEILKEKKRIGIKGFEIKDSHIVIDSRTHLISGLDADQKLSGRVYNKYHISGDFFEIPKSAYNDELYLKIESYNNESMSGTWKMEYKFYYV